MVDTEERVGTSEVPIVDPARDVRDDIMDAYGVPEMLDKIWFHKTASAVIDADRCVGCGACIAACPSKSIGVGSDGLPTLVRRYGFDISLDGSDRHRGHLDLEGHSLGAWSLPEVTNLRALADSNVVRIRTIH